MLQELKRVKRVLPASRPHWVGNGFNVFPVFANLAFTNELSPWCGCKPTGARAACGVTMDSLACKPTGARAACDVTMALTRVRTLQAHV